jgi:UrcA family protein
MFRPLLALAFTAANLIAVTAPVLAATPVSTAGLDLATAAGSQALDARLVRAARAECQPDNPLDLRAAMSAKTCETAALGRARASAQYLTAQAEARQQTAARDGR